MNFILKHIVSFAAFVFVSGIAQADISADLTLVIGPSKFSQAIYGNIKNDTGQTISLEIKSCEYFAHVMLHETLEKDGQSSMQHVEKVSLEPGQLMLLQQGGMHLMAMKPQQNIAKQQSLHCTFIIDAGLPSAKEVSVPVVLKPLINPS